MAVMFETSTDLCLGKDFLISASMMEGLNRINQAGAERAQQVLVSFLGQEEPVTIDSISILPLTMLAQRLRAGRREYLGCHVRIFGELQAELYFYLAVQDARTLMNAVFRHQHLRRNLGSVELSALTEMASVLTNSYWLALHGHVALNWRSTPPAVVGRIERVFALASRIGHYDYLAFHADFALANPGAHLFFCLIPGADCLNRFLQSIESEHLHNLVNN